MKEHLLGYILNASTLQGTGKSLFQSVMMRALKGQDIPPTKSCTEAEAYVTLSKGEHIYGMYTLNLDHSSSL